MVVLPPSFRKYNAGFSLLELIIVLVIIGIMVASVVISITDTRRDKLHFEARRLAGRLALARDEAILTNQEMGLEIERDQYRFLFLGEERWETSAPEEDKQLTEQKLPEGMELQLRVDGLFSEFDQKSNFNKLFRDTEEFEETNVNAEEDEAALALRPQIYLMSSGEVNPFTLVIGFDDDNPVYYQLEATFDGKVSLDGPFQESMKFALTRADSNSRGKQ